jgi:hypothetical protein
MERLATEALENPPRHTPPVRPTSPADVWMRRLLRVPDRVAPISEAELRRGVSASVLVSATRCLLTYIVLPFVLPALSLAAGVGPLIGLPLGLVAIVANVVTARRFWLADHRYRWPYTALATVILALLVVLVVSDIAELLS